MKVARAEDSAIARFVRGSWLYGAATRTPRDPLPLLKHAAIFRLGLIPYAFYFLVASCGIATLWAVMAKQVALAAFAGGVAVALVLPAPALFALPALLMWAPRLEWAAAGGELLFLRLDQSVVVGLWLHAATHPRAALRSPPANTPFLLFLLCITASALAGVLQNTLHTSVSSLLYLGQWFTLYGLYVVAWSFGPRLGSVWIYAWTLPLLALAAYGLAEHVWPYYAPPGERYRTFERVLFGGQANHAAGLLALATVSGLALALQPRYRGLGLTLAVLASLALWPTGSRSGAVTWVAGVVVLASIQVRTLRWWLPPLLALALAAIPLSWWHAASAPGSSMHDRLIAWKSALSTVDVYPLLGLGAGARHRSFYDNHYVMTLAESGAIGLLALVLLLLALGHALGHARTSCPAGACAGALAGLAALSVHGLANVTFIITLVAGPFFWYCGIALSRGLPRR